MRTFLSLNIRTLIPLRTEIGVYKTGSKLVGTFVALLLGAGYNGCINLEESSSLWPRL